MAKGQNIFSHAAFFPSISLLPQLALQNSSSLYTLPSLLFNFIPHLPRCFPSYQLLASPSHASQHPLFSARFPLSCLTSSPTCLLASPPTNFLLPPLALHNSSSLYTLPPLLFKFIPHLPRCFPSYQLLASPSHASQLPLLSTRSPLSCLISSPTCLVASPPPAFLLPPFALHNSFCHLYPSSTNANTSLLRKRRCGGREGRKTAIVPKKAVASLLRHIRIRASILFRTPSYGTFPRFVPTPSSRFSPPRS